MLLPKWWQKEVFERLEFHETFVLNLSISALNIPTSAIPNP